MEIADDELLKKIYAAVEPRKQFVFSSLAQNENIDIAVDGDQFFSKHIAVVGSTGSGKSGTVAKILQEGINPSADQSSRTMLNNSHILLFDLHGEYGPAFPSAKLLNITNLVLPYWLMNPEELEEMLIESNENTSHNQISQFRYAVLENKKRHNASAVNLYYDSPVYFSIIEVLNYIFNLNEEMLGKAEGENGQPKLSDGTLVDDRLNFVLSPRNAAGSEYNTADLSDILTQFLGYSTAAKKNVTILDLSGIPFEVLSIVVSLISRLVFDFCFYFKSLKEPGIEAPYLIVLEEAHNYIPQSEGSTSANGLPRYPKPFFPSAIILWPCGSPIRQISNM